MTQEDRTLLNKIQHPNGKKLAALVYVLALTVSLVTSGAGLASIPASAAGETISASKTTFFGSNVVEVTIVDDNLEDNNDGAEQDEITVSFDVRSGTDSAIDDVTVGDDAGDVSAEIGDSGRFVFYVTADADVTVSDLADAEFDSDSQIVHVTEGGEIDIGSDSGNDALDSADDGISLNEGATLTITYGDASIDLTYQDDKGDLLLDRTSVGTDGFLYLRIDDQDANNDPTGRDTLNFDNTIGNLTVTYTGAANTNLGQIISDASLSIQETSDNSGLFEARLPVTSVLGITAASTPKTVKLELQDFEVYPNDLFYDSDEVGVPGDDSTSESVKVDNVDGLLQGVTNPASPRTELAVTVNDPDRNLDSKVKDRIKDAIAADLSSTGADDDETINATPVDLIETEVNSGIFVPDLSNNVFEVTIGPVTDNDGILQIEDSSAAKSDILTRYADFTPDIASDINTDIDNGESGGDAGADAKIILFKGKAAANTPAVIALAQSSIGAQDRVTLELTDPDLNDDADAVDSFDLTIPASSFSSGSLTVSSITFNGIDIADLRLDSVIDGNEASSSNPLDDILVSFQETSSNSSVFEAEFDYGLLASAAESEEGDNTEFKWFDQLLDSPLESSVRLTVNEASEKVAWQQNEYALPFVQEDRGTVDFDGQIDAKRTRVKLLITDPALNQDSSSVEQRSFSLIDDPGNTDASATGFPDLTLRLVGANGRLLLSPDAGEITACGGLTTPATFTETGANTGIFDKTFDFMATAGSCLFDVDELANARLIADYDDETASTVLKGYNGILTTSSRTISSGQEITITVNDKDQNHDRDVREQVAIEIEPDGLATETELLDETETNSGIFSKNLVVGEDFGILDDEELVDDVTVTYDDAVTASGSTSEERELKLLPPSGNGKLLISPESGVGPGTKLVLTLLDIDLNDDPNARDIIDFDVLELRSNNRDIDDNRISLGEDGLEMEETSNTSGEFKLTITLVPITPEQLDDDLVPSFLVSGDEIDFPAEPGDVISIGYDDENHNSNGQDTVSVTVEVGSFDPQISTDKQAYLPGETIKLTIRDPDANRDPDVIDIIEDIRVHTDADAVGESFDAVETGPSTGNFTVDIPIVDGFESDAVTARIGDTLTIEYTDEFPAGYDPDDADDKVFTYAVKVGTATAGGGVSATSPSAPEVKDIEGQSLDHIDAGTQVVLATTIANNLEESRPFVVIIEVRDSAGITVFLAWQTGTLPSSGEAEIGLSWQPDTPGDYQVRTLVLSSLATPEVLSPVEMSDVTVT